MGFSYRSRLDLWKPLESDSTVLGSAGTALQVFRRSRSQFILLWLLGQQVTLRSRFYLSDAPPVGARPQEQASNTRRCVLLYARRETTLLREWLVVRSNARDTSSVLLPENRLLRHAHRNRVGDCAASSGDSYDIGLYLVLTLLGRT